MRSPNLHNDPSSSPSRSLKVMACSPPPPPPPHSPYIGVVCGIGVNKICDILDPFLDHDNRFSHLLFSPTNTRPQNLAKLLCHPLLPPSSLKSATVRKSRNRWYFALRYDLHLDLDLNTPPSPLPPLPFLKSCLMPALKSEYSREEFVAYCDFHETWEQKLSNR